MPAAYEVNINLDEAERVLLKEIKDLCILVVDDEPDLGELVSFEFELVGAKVLSASNGREAFEAVKNNHVDVVVSDIRMPGGDGVELLENIRKADPAAPALVFMTGFADITLEDAYDKGATAMFGKPFNRNELISTVGRSVLPYKERWSEVISERSRNFTIEKKFKNLKEAQDNKELNLGRGGIFIAADKVIPEISELVHFKIEFEEEFKNLEGEGIVRWVRRRNEKDVPKGIGLEIKSIVGDERDKIFSFLEKSNSIAFIPKC